MRIPDAPHALPPDDVARELSVDASSGVLSSEIEQRREAFGANVLVRDTGRPAWRIFLHQFASVIVLLLAAAAVVAFLTRDRAEAVAIAAVLVLNALIGFTIEWQSARALRKLELQMRTQARVLRDGRELLVDAEDLVVGDVIILEAGAHIGADARVLEGASLDVEESTLTGESVPVTKTAEPVDAAAPLADRKSMVHLGTWVTAGHGRAIVTAVGEQTELGRIGRLVRESADEATPLERQLAMLGHRLVYLVLAIAAVVIATGVLRGERLWDMVEFGISLAVAAVPEGMPAVTTLILALGVLRMAKHNAIVRRLPAVETLGSATVICTDKTGTLTLNRLTVRVLDTHDRERMLRAMVLCNDATLETGDPTEVALLAAARDEGIDIDAMRARYPRTGEEPFDHQTKRMITMHGALTLVKGAPGVVVEMCPGADRDAVLRRNEELASQALRVLAVAEKSTGDYELLGLVAMHDPPRDDAAQAIADARDAGMRVVMLTGDQLETARAIAKEIRISGDREPRVVHARDLAGASIPEIDVFARVSPADKLDIVDKLRAANEVVAVTGDGVNDAPALRRADIGIVMGKSGTEVAKKSADLVLTDDNLGTIVRAVAEGRTIYSNIRKFVHLLFSHNLGEVLTVFIAIVAGLPLPLLPLQLLWVNLVTDVFPAFALAMEPMSKESMRRPSRTSLLARDFVILVAWQGAMLAAITLGAYVFALSRHGAGDHARSVTFFALVAVQIGHTFNCRSRIASAFTGLTRNIHLWFGVLTVVALQLAAYAFAPLARILRVTSLDRTDAYVLAACVLLPVAIVEVQKLVVRWRR